MTDNIQTYMLVVVLAPLLGAGIAGFFGKKIGCAGAHWVTVLLIGVSLTMSLWLCQQVLFHGLTYNGNLYTWVKSGSVEFNVGFLLDRLSSLMMVVVTFVSFLVHIYSIGYMKGDPGYQRFFSYISLFTFFMLMLVSGNNFMQLFFGWEGVGLASYLLIGFWFKRESANQGSLKAFLVNRVGDFGFILGIAAVLDYFGTIDYAAVFAKAPALAASNLQITVIPGMEWSLVTVICIALFIGAMGKSAQVPLHVWLPESMEGPTPISALIHAATMVTAGVYMVSRMSPLFELSDTALSMVLIVGATGALFTGLLAVVQNDIKRVVAYSTLSQLGYMVAALGVSAFSAGMFHLFTHACFKALLFLAAGSVIIGMHHEQDLRKMGNLRRYMPITYVTFLIGALSLSALPPFAGFYSKDAIIEAVRESHIWGASYGYLCVLLGAFVTALYTFRAFFMAFHTTERMDEHTREHLHESPAVVWVPLVILAIPSIILGAIMAGPILYQTPGLLGDSIYVAAAHDVLGELAKEYKGIWITTAHALFSLPCWLALFGIATAWFCYVARPEIPGMLAQRLPRLYDLLMAKYGFDDFNQKVFVMGSRRLGTFLYRQGDIRIIDHSMVNGSGRFVNWISAVTRKLQSGYLYHYAFAMMAGLLVLLVYISVN